MPLSSGTRLGPYEITAPLGAGGMGEVYRARDTRLGRDVAVKILPAEVADDPSRRQRFEIEARAVAALNHPNIVAVYDVGENYIVTELVDGESLRGARFGLRKTLDVAVQIASGLAAAYDAGIVHRDLKPDNILLARDGRVKILDFGLAKVIAVGGTGGAAETLTVHTDPGVVMGTVGYMSPEQVRGHTADHRSDIFSLGLILYELLSNKRAFHGDTSVETMTAILKQDPPDLPETIPRPVREIVAHCIEKEPAHRFQSAKDLSFALAHSGSQSAKTATLVIPSHWRRGIVAFAVVALVALAVFAGHLLWPAPAQPSWTGVMLGGPEMSYYPRPSPKGDLVAFAAKDRDDVQQLWVMKPESGNRMMLTHNRNRGYVNSCAWSADGNRVYYDRWLDQPKGVFSVPALGGDEQLVLEDAQLPEALPDGSLLLSKTNAEHRNQVFRYWPDSGKLQGYAIQPLMNWTSCGRAIPGGREALMLGTRVGPGAEAGSNLYVVDLASGNMRQLPEESPGEFSTFGAAFAAARDGTHALVSSGRGSMFRVATVPLDGRGPRRTLLTLTHAVFSLDAGPDGSIYLDQIDRPGDLLRFPVDGGRVEKIATSANSGLSLSDGFAVLPDGRAVWVEKASGRNRLIVVETGREPVPLASTLDESAPPMTAVGAGEVAFMIGSQPRRTIALAALSNGRITHRLGFDKGEVTSMAASPDGKTLYCAANGTIWAVPVSGEALRKIRAGDFVTVDTAAQSLIVLVQEPPNTRLVRIPLSGGPEQEIAGPFHLANGIDPGSIRNGKLVAPLSSSYWYWPPGFFDLASGKSARIPLDYTNDFHHMAWTPDGRIMAVALGWRSAIWKFTPEKR